MLRDLLATCPAWLERLGRPADASGADHIHFNEWIEEQDANQTPFPLLVIATPEGGPIFDFAAGGDQIYLNAVNSQIALELCDVRRFPENTADDSIDFENFAGALVEYIAEKSGQDGILEVTKIDWTMPPRTTTGTRLNRQEQRWMCGWALTWGLTG
jgi:hypothetical protein